MTFLAVSVVLAQAAIPINVNENKLGTLPQGGAAIDFSLTSAAPQSIIIQTLSITAGLKPAFDLIDPSGIIIGTAPNAGGVDIVQGTFSLPAAGTYGIRVHSTVGAAGDFLLSIQTGPALQPPQPLVLGQPSVGQVDSQNTRRAYSFTGSQTDALVIAVSSDQIGSAPNVVLKNAATNEVLAMINTQLNGAQLRISPALAPLQFLLEVTYGGTSAVQPFTVCLESASAASNCGFAPAQVPTTVSSVPTAQATVAPPSQPTIQVVEIPPAGPCQVATAGESPVNVRQGPGLEFPIITHLNPNTLALVFGRLPDNSWFQVSVNGLVGWVSATVVRIGGMCGSVSVVQPPTPPPTVPAPTATPTLTPTFTLTPAPGGTFVFPPIARATLIAPIQVVPLNPRLDYTANPNYGEANLSAGFSPDPYSVGMTTGGNVDVSYLGGSCSGFATSAPDLRINFGGGGSSLLRIYFVGANGDPAIVVNDPYGNFYCVDDSFGTVNPTIDFNNPAGGSYDVWVASYASGTHISGTLYITENSGNHP